MPIRCFRTASGLRACPSSVRDRVPGSSGHHWRRFWAFVLNRKSRKQTPFGRTLTDSKDFGSFGKPRDGSFQQRHNMGNRSRVLKSYGHLCESLHTSVTEGWGPRSPGVPQSFWQRGVLLLTHRTTSLLITSTLFRTLCKSQGDQLPHTPHLAVPIHQSKNQNYGNLANRNRTSDRWISFALLQSTALPTELSRGNVFSGEIYVYKY